MKNILAAVLWTGGKDSMLALHRVLESGLEVKCLATFIPESGKEFVAHSRSESLLQSQRLGIPLTFLPVGKDIREDYLKGLQALVRSWGISTVVTGDIGQVDGFPNWIVELGSEIGLTVLRPLWGENREDLLSELISREIRARISWVDAERVPTRWLGREIDVGFARELKTYARDWGIDICGENGEFHTTVFKSPLFKVRQALCQIPFALLLIFVVLSVG